MSIEWILLLPGIDWMITRPKLPKKLLIHVILLEMSMIIKPNEKRNYSLCFGE